ncbi:zinc finger protein 554-like [Anoplopoma fimbria]|uniref:zinc finger protein 554-like n=1 Tax=Anoplopoma fimbria TaxID=229290 RepID=UPI0023ED8595|nr:zinc finger protein 554-like [Anoplopoma fimbria]
MCPDQTVSVLVKQQLAAAAEDICGLFETTVADLEDEIDRLCRLLEDGNKADIQQVLVCKEEQQEWQPSLDQEDPDPPHLKEEQEELWSSQKGEQLQGLEEDDTAKLPFTAVPVKSGPRCGLSTVKLKQTAGGLLVKQHLEQIVELFERTVAEYEKKLSCSKEEIDRQHKLLDAVLKPEVRLHRADVQQVMVCKEEQQELWSSHEGEQTQGLEEDDINKFPFTAVSVKSEDEEGNAWSSQLHQRQTVLEMKTTADTESDPASNNNHSVSSESETEDSDDVSTETRETQSHLNALKNTNSQSVKKMCIVCGKTLCSKRSIYSHMTVHTELQSFICPICGKMFTHKRSLFVHMKGHVEGNPFTCSVCKKEFKQSRSLIEHIRTHTGEKPYRCSVCNKCFHRRGVWIVHTKSHLAEKPFSCSQCGKKFGHQAHLRKHVKRHSAEKPFSCSICGKSFNDKGHLKRHKKVHLEEKPLGCDECGRRFIQERHFKNHKCVTFPTDP